MQIVYQDEDERNSSKRTGVVGFIIHTRRIGGYLEREYNRRSKNKSLSYVTVEEFLSDLKEEFGGRDNKMIKMVELKKIE